MGILTLDCQNVMISFVEDTQYTLGHIDQVVEVRVAGYSEMAHKDVQEAVNLNRDDASKLVNMLINTYKLIKEEHFV